MNFSKLQHKLCDFVLRKLPVGKIDIGYFDSEHLKRNKVKSIRLTITVIEKDFTQDKLRYQCIK